MLQATERNDNAFRFTSAAAGEQNVKWVIALDASSRRRRNRAGNFCDAFRREEQRGAQDCQNFVDALLGQYCVQRNIRSAGFYRPEKCDQHLRLSVSKHGDGSAIFAETVCQVRSERIRTPTEFAVSEPPIAA